MKTAFERWEVYQTSERLADPVFGMASEGEGFARDTGGRPLVRAADGIGANIAEGYGRGTGLDHRRFIRTARGSLNETQHWLRRAFRPGLMTRAQVDVPRPLMVELGLRLNAYLKSIRVEPADSPRD